MKTGFIFLLFTFVGISCLNAQRNCTSHSYQQDAFANNAILKNNFEAIESFITKQQNQNTNEANRIESSIIKIPVVVHILYHTPNQKIKDAVVQNQIKILNECFRRQNADTTNTPARFKGLAADCEIEFQLATSDPKRRYTSGITSKYTPIEEWEAKDDMKYTSKLGMDAWDTKAILISGFVSWIMLQAIPV